jgi:hypothetical protein
MLRTGISMKFGSLCSFSFVNPHNASPGLRSLCSQCAHTQTHITDSTVHSATVRARQFGCKSTLARVHQKKQRERERRTIREREYNKKRARRVRAVRVPTTLLPCALLLVLFITLCLFDSRWRKQASSVSSGANILCALAQNMYHIIIACRFISYASKNKMIINAVPPSPTPVGCLPLGGYGESAN